MDSLTTVSLESNTQIKINFDVTIINDIYLIQSSNTLGL